MNERLQPAGEQWVASINSAESMEDGAAAVAVAASADKDKDPAAEAAREAEAILERLRAEGFTGDEMLKYNNYIGSLRTALYECDPLRGMSTDLLKLLIQEAMGNYETYQKELAAAQAESEEGEDQLGDEPAPEAKKKLMPPPIAHDHL